MKLPIIKKILREDISTAPSWIDQVIGPINSFMETIYMSMNKNLTFTENLASFVKELTYKADGTTVVSFPNTLKTKAMGVVLLQAFQKKDYTPVLTTVYIPWVESNNEIKISPIIGLTNGETYTIRVLVI